MVIGLRCGVSQLARAHSVDVLVLAECPVAPAVTRQALNEENSLTFQETDRQAKATQIFTRFSSAFLTPVEDDGERITVRKLAIPEKTEILLAGVHMVSKLFWSDDSQLRNSLIISHRIREIERRQGHTRTILVGDLI